jgi:hypothetical protein
LSFQTGYHENISKSEGYHFFSFFATEYMQIEPGGLGWFWYHDVTPCVGSWPNFTFCVQTKLIQDVVKEGSREGILSSLFCLLFSRGEREAV